MLYGVAIEKSCALFISSFRRWQTNRLEQRLHAACRRARIFIKIYFDFMSLLLFRFIIIFFLFCFWAFCSRRVQCQKCEAVLFFFSCFWHATCTSLLPAPKIVGNLSGILSSTSLSLPVSVSLYWHAHVGLNCFIWVPLCVQAGTSDADRRSSLLLLLLSSCPCLVFFSFLLFFFS